MALATIPIPSYAEETGNLNIGDYIVFGKFEGEPILWRVIQFDEDGDALLFSDKILCVKPFYSQNKFRETIEKYGKHVNYTSWEYSSIREWLNSEKDGFLSNQNFSEQEKKLIKSVTQKSLSPKPIEITKYTESIHEGGKYYFSNSLKSDKLKDIANGYDNAYYVNVTDKVFFVRCKANVRLTHEIFQ